MLILLFVLWVFFFYFFFFFQAEDGIRDRDVTGVQTCALPIWPVRTGRGTTWCKCGHRTGRHPAAGAAERRQPRSGPRPRRSETVGVPHASIGGTGPAESRFAEAFPRVADTFGRRGERRRFAAAAGVARAAAPDRWLPRRG